MTGGKRTRSLDARIEALEADARAAAEVPIWERMRDAENEVRRRIIAMTPQIHAAAQSAPELTEEQLADNLRSLREMIHERAREALWEVDRERR